MKAFGKYGDQASYSTPLDIADLADALTGTYVGLNGQESALQLADIFIYANEAKTQAMVAFDYYDRGFRLSKITYDSLHQPAWRTWYVRDGSGAVLSIYVQNLTAAGEPIQYEVPVYGSGRVGMYRPLDQANYYELKDHLGNVRVVIGGSTSVDYLATMEAYRDSLENPYFERNKVVTVADHLNHTPDSLANKAVRINNVLDQEPNAVGAGITLRVFPGDTLRAQVFAKYEDFDNSTNNVIPALAGYLGTVFGVPGVGENPISPFDVVDDPSFLSLEAWNQFDDQQPRLYLNYLLYDNNFNLVDFGFDQVSEAAKVPGDTTLLVSHAFEELVVEVTAQQAGFIYVYVSNENDQNVTAYFDDLGVEHTYGNIAVVTDRYPFGLAMAGRELERVKWRYGYQGDFAEEDEETGWNSFELRMYDPVVGRWTTTDPVRQFWSSYLSMGNNPVNRTDPDGSFSPPSTHTDADGNVVAVYDDGDLGIYRHDDLSNWDGQSVLAKSGEGITKMGYTYFWDEFRLHDNETGEILDEVAGKILFGETFDYDIAYLHNNASSMNLSEIAANSTNNKQFDLKTDPLFAPYGEMTGQLLNGKYVSARSAGNFLAGYNGSTGTMYGISIGWYHFIKMAGAVHQNEWKGRSTAINIIGGAVSYGSSPWFGEIEYAGRMILMGWNYGRR